MRIARADLRTRQRVMPLGTRAVLPVPGTLLMVFALTLDPLDAQSRVSACLRSRSHCRGSRVQAGFRTPGGCAQCHHEGKGIKHQSTHSRNSIPVAAPGTGAVRYGGYSRQSPGYLTDVREFWGRARPISAGRIALEHGPSSVPALSLRRRSRPRTSAHQNDARRVFTLVARV